ncbi:hypothetical protein ACLOJK_000311 [Asimina triloba]
MHSVCNVAVVFSGDYVFHVGAGEEVAAVVGSWQSSSMEAACFMWDGGFWLGCHSNHLQWGSVFHVGAGEDVNGMATCRLWVLNDLACHLQAASGGPITFAAGMDERLGSVIGGPDVAGPSLASPASVACPQQARVRRRYLPAASPHAARSQLARTRSQLSSSAMLATHLRLSSTHLPPHSRR